MQDSSRKLIKATGGVVIAILLSNIFVYIRDIIIAAKFGLSGLTDVYIFAYGIPEIIVGIMTAAVVSVYMLVNSEYLAAGDGENSASFAGTLFFILIGALFLITLVCYIFLGDIINILAYGFSETQKTMTRRFTSIILPVIISGGIIGLFSGMLNSRRYFFIPSVMPVVLNVSIITAIFVSGGAGIKGIAWGIMAGSLVQLCIIYLSVLKKGIKINFRFSPAQPGIKKFMILVLPVFGRLIIEQITLQIDRSIASGLAAGSITALNYAFKIIYLPVNIFAMAVSTVIFPSLALAVSSNDSDELKRNLSLGIRLIFLAVIPALTGILLLRRDLISLLFERGLFNAGATEYTSSLLVFYFAGMIAFSINLVLAKVMYAYGDVGLLVKIGVVNLFITAGLDWVLSGTMGASGIALASTAVNVFQLLILVLYCRYRMKTVLEPGSMRFLLLSAIGNILIVAAGAVVIKFSGALGAVPRVALTVSLCAAVYYAFMLLTGSRDIKKVISLLKNKLSGGRNA